MSLMRVRFLQSGDVNQGSLVGFFNEGDVAECDMMTARHLERLGWVYIYKHGQKAPIVTPKAVNPVPAPPPKPAPVLENKAVQPTTESK